ncbi:MAG: glycosyltransferase family 39 protein [bacterium]|nr:glycosyltransferase family 39 protein [bacterium]
MEPPASAQTTPSPTNHGIPLLVLVIVAAGVRVPLLFDSVWFDEACLSHQRIGTFAQLLATIYVDSHPPLWVTVMYLWTQLFGDAEWVLRLPSLLLGLLTIPLLYRVGRRLVGPEAAIWAVALLAISPPHVWYSTDAGLPAASTFMALLAVHSFERLLVTAGTCSRWRWVLYVVSLGTLLLLDYYLGFFLIVLAIAAPLVARGFTRTALNVLCWHGAGLMLLALWIWGKQRVGEFDVAHVDLEPLTPAALYEFFVHWSLTGNALEPFALHDVLGLWLPAGLAIALMGFGLVHVLSRQQQYPLGTWVPALALTIPGCLVLMAWAELGNTYAARSCLPSLPYVLLLLGAGIRLTPRVARPVAGGLLLLVLAGALFGIYRHGDSHWTVHRPTPDWRAATHWLGDAIDRDPTTRPVYCSMSNPRPLPYYDSRIQHQKTMSPKLSPAAIRDRITASFGSWLGTAAGDFADEFANHNSALLAAAKLRVHASASSPDRLPVAPPADGICYLVRNRWHPPAANDHTIADLLTHAKVTVLEHRAFQGIDVYKVKILP